MYWQYGDERAQMTQGMVPQPQGFYDVPMRHNIQQERQEMTNFAFADDDGGEVKRPMNSFLLWAKVMRKKYAKENPTMHNAEISKLLGKVWNGMTTNEKRPYVERAERLRVIHMRDHPNYRYAPRKKKERKQAQRMISPEIAAAFHNAIFDLRTVMDRRQKEEEMHTGCDLMMLTSRREDTKNMLYQNLKNQQMNAANNYTSTANVMSNNNASTYQYYGGDDKNFKAEKPQDDNTSISDPDQISASFDRQVSASSGHFYSNSNTPNSWCDSASNGESDASSIVPSSPESTTECLDQEVPPFLRALLEFPIHVDHRRTTKVEPGVHHDDGSYILNDLREIVGKESVMSDQRKSCMFL